ncbi:septum formation inhibitor Maf [Corynebacterium sp. 13CS0277]|uniref:Maf family protein n=1 Tax=Corynebacterium sp. 13CS0277 TaxID=2071994 RepID=UPI000D032D73|nr:nucleoside triphosphate pyrophosphatase [Corynebacterium sp. 13CS0277]PRQ10400.1 septum formation inhibitor Maf [Corynebacterium sp. 13CS0277]
MQIVLASSSPSRVSVLRSAGVEPLICPPEGVDEDALLEQLAQRSPEERVCALARAKAQSVAHRHPGAVVIGGDSMLLIDGELQGKPHTVEVAVARWLAQRGRTAQLVSGHCVLGPEGQEYVEASTTTLSFADVPEKDIVAYARTGEPLGCAGAFTLEAMGGWFIDRIEGDPSGVIGLSLPVVRRALYSFDIPVAAVMRPELLVHPAP